MKGARWRNCSGSGINAALMRQQRPEISVVIPIYNEAKILAGAVADLHAELSAFEPAVSFEILLAENGSRDSTVEVAESLRERYPEVSVFCLGEPNYGAALRRGILQARGRFVICDEIDLCDTDFHTRALELLRAGEVDLVVGLLEAFPYLLY